MDIECWSLILIQWSKMIIQISIVAQYDALHTKFNRKWLQRKQCLMKPLAYSIVSPSSSDSISFRRVSFRHPPSIDSYDVLILNSSITLFYFSDALYQRTPAVVS